MISTGRKKKSIFNTLIIIGGSWGSWNPRNFTERLTMIWFALNFKTIKTMPNHPVTTKDLFELKVELLKEFKAMLNRNEKLSEKKWLKSYEVRKMLNLSPNTLQTLRDNGTLPCSKIGGSYYYEYSVIEKLLEKSSSSQQSLKF